MKQASSRPVDSFLSKHAKLLIIGLVLCVVIGGGVAWARRSTLALAPVPVVTVSPTGVTVSGETKHITPEELVAKSGVPSAKLSAKYAGVDIYWSQGSVVDGSDTCTAYNPATLQIYATKTQSAGNSPDRTVSVSNTYYSNNMIEQVAAVNLLNVWCYKAQ